MRRPPTAYNMQNEVLGVQLSTTMESQGSGIRTCTN
ncbi:uncharacterized protein J3R85_018891 [Psidium guajava]|nr:uncharacterized protein J3R85_018891 [Psidium guajava]